MLKEGLILMTTGMGTVFIFLIIMIFVMYLMEKAMIIINKIMPLEEEIAPKTVKTDKKQEIAVAIAALKAFR
jgi:sodium pump decarboxylase gamma subunit